jgi:hypothetical protein
MRPILCLLLPSLTLIGAGCEKNVQEVRRSEPGIVAPGGNLRTSSANAPAAPSGAPASIGAAPRSPTDRR